MTAQLGLTLEGGAALIPDRLFAGEFGSGDDMPPGPYSAGLTYWIAGDGGSHEGMPYTVRCGDGRAVAGHIPSRPIAEAIADALNTARPV